MIDSAKEAGFFIYQAMGGEPLLVKEFPRILAYAKKNGFLTYLNTNGILLKRKVKKIAPFIDAVAVSIDGSESVHNKMRNSKNAYKKAVEGINEAKKMEIKLKINSTIGSDNINEMDKLLKLAESLDVPITFSVMLKKGKIEFGPNELKEFSEKVIYLKRESPLITNSISGIKYYLKDFNRFCKYFNVFLWVSPSGEIDSCMNQVVGNVKTMSFEEILNSKKYEQFRNKTKKCKKRCDIAVACVTETSSLYNLNFSRIMNFLRNGFL